ncbi:DUF2630 family protein [Actinomadura madurae]|uniref:DUF2630 family protein n=1 Tax=Actinomadura madurae TaxID=1993 RepID=UPI0020262F9F|nr:DUF2630 family protein [Actinomadura madurae]MCP9953304.1 DUF2630 family protein [Actinomadura madurae]MCP9970063.1 DUF2630 family protein [Actinomadura madurae]MCP9982522.1 DUF2630 family protein [Actinomadura madurae]MCQ0005941.1 DUF2630 family protein [Actinomadura madurae]MCQ0018769.1 DUF2630 family protein [Actinomadura madurae]
MDEKDVLERIGEYVGEEQRLRERYQRDELGREEEHRRLESLEVALDQCWDLLRRRRARLEAGGDPDDTEARPPDEVEGYLQ